MCGILGILVAQDTDVTTADIRQLADKLFVFSETRGREAAGLAVHDGQAIRVLKRPDTASDFIRRPEYAELLGHRPLGPRRPFSLIGHSRLVTNGRRSLLNNTQPVLKQGVVAVHNGIIVNDDALWRTHPEATREYQVDTEILAQLIGGYRAQGDPTGVAVQRAMDEIEGTVSAALFSQDEDSLALVTNTGSLFLAISPRQDVAVFASERFILTRLLASAPATTLLADAAVVQLDAGSGCIIRLSTLARDDFRLTGQPQAAPATDAPSAQPVPVVQVSAPMTASAVPFRRCRRCILPSTMPFLRFDEDGVCSLCRNYQPQELLGAAALEAVLAKYRGGRGADCLIGLSGGRDSCYGLHVIKKVFGMNPVAFTYDWGLITDLARRNQARLCGKLGVEHIIVSADIERKRRNVKRNVEAWLKRPDLGLIPLFMAGDKQYFYHADQLMKQTGARLLVLSENGRYEKSRFKSGFCGVDEANRRVFNISMFEKGKMALYYGANFARNPRYLNGSLFDSMTAFASTYFITHDFVSPFDYVPWKEEEVVATLEDEYRWERADDTSSTWRIGDGTAAFYNYIYYTVAGFSEHDTFRSAQIRAGALTREDALQRAHEDNKPRWESLEWYARTIGFDLDEALRIIDAIPRLYAGSPA